MQETLDKLVADYGLADSTLKDLKKTCDIAKDEIKKRMESEGESEHTSGGYTVKYIVSEKTTVDEEKMLQILKRDWVKRNGSAECPYIRRVEVLDMDALESELYAENIPKDVVAELGTCNTINKVVTLRCSKAKKEEKKNE